jgi:hypothetical protein
VRQRTVSGFRIHAVEPRAGHYVAGNDFEDVKVSWLKNVVFFEDAERVRRVRNGHDKVFAGSFLGEGLVRVQSKVQSVGGTVSSWIDQG